MHKYVMLVLLVLNIPVFGQGHWTVDSSAVSFKIRNAGIMVDGTFDGLAAEIDFNPKKLNRSSIEASVDAGTIDSGIRLRNKHLRRPDYFYVDSFPRIRMRSVNFKKMEEGHFLGEFILSLKGREGKVPVPFSYQKEGDHYVLEGQFDMDRREFDIGSRSILLSDKVQVSFLIKTRPK